MVGSAGTGIPRFLSSGAVQQWTIFYNCINISSSWYLTMPLETYDAPSLPIQALGRLHRALLTPNQNTSPRIHSWYHPQHQRPATSKSPYPNVITTKKVMTLAGIPLEMKCLTCKYRWPVCESSIMIAATKLRQPLLPMKTRREEAYSYSGNRWSVDPWRQSTLEHYP